LELGLYVFDPIAFAQTGKAAPFPIPERLCDDPYATIIPSPPEISVV